MSRPPYPFELKRPPLDMSVEACRERLASYEKDPQCYRSKEQLEADRAVVEKEAAR